jgi:hypothetical protein
VLPKPQGIGRVPNKFSVQADCGDWVGMNPDTLAAMESVPYQIKTKEGELLWHGTTNNQGNTSRVYTADAQELVLYVGDGDWEYSIDCLHT